MTYDEGLAQRVREALEEKPGVESDGDLAAWVERGLAFASTFPAKQPSSSLFS